MANLIFWFFAVAVIVLPAMSQTGYQPYSLEYGIAAVGLVGIAALCWWLGRIRWLAPLLLIAAVLLSVTLYFGAPLSVAYWRIGLGGLLATGFAALAIMRFDAALRLAGIAGLAQIAVTAVSVPTTIQSVIEHPRARTDVAPIIHLLLDEHAGPAAYPLDIVAADDVKAFEDAYVSRGFTVFRKAYSFDKNTYLSLGRLFNPRVEKPPVTYVPAIPAYQVMGAEALHAIARDRVLDLTYASYLSLVPALANIANVGRLATYDVFVTADAIGQSGMPHADRMLSAAALTVTWLHRKAQSPLMLWFLGKTDMGKRLAGQLDPQSRGSPVYARQLLRDFFDRLRTQGQRGTYYFAHVLLPHYPYVFDRSCAIIPSRDWLNRINSRVGEPDTVESRKARYLLQMDQTLCLADQLGTLIDGLKENPAMRDAVIVLHGDHGSRIAIEKYAGDPSLYTQADYERDWRGTFMAVRMPGTTAGTVDVPLRFDKIFERMTTDRFQRLDVQAIERMPGSPY